MLQTATTQVKRCGSRMQCERQHDYKRRMSYVPDA